MTDKHKEINIPDEPRINIRQFIISKILRHWYLYLISLAVFIPIAYYYNWYVTPVYNATATLLISDNKRNLSQQDLLAQVSTLDNTGGVDNEIELIRARSMVAKTLRKLDFEVSYFLQGNIKRSELYRQSPIKFEFDSLSFRVYELPINIRILDSTRFEFDYPGDERSSPIREEYRFNEQVVNDIGKFTIEQTSKFRSTDYMDPEFEKRNFIVYVHRFDHLIDKYTRNLQIEFLSKKSTIVELSLKDPVPQKAGDFLNMLMEVYLQSGVEHKNEIAANTLKFIDEQLKLISEDLRASEEDLEVFKTTKGITDLGTEAQSFLGSAKVYDEKISSIDIQKSFLNYLEKYIMEDKELEKISPASIGINDPLLTKLITQLADLQNQRKMQLNSTKPDNPIIVSLDIQIQNTTEDLLENVRSIRDGLEASRQEAEAQLNRIQGKIRTVPGTERALAGIIRQANIKEGLYNYLLQKRAETAIVMASTISDNRVVNSARASFKPVKPVPAQTYTFALLFGLIFPLGMLYLRDMLNDKISDVSEINHLTEIPVIGMVGFSKEASNHSVTDKPESMLAESFRLIRTNISFYSAPGKTVRVLITSSISSEGKSFCASNLAAIYALSGKKVALVQGDLRKPKKNTEFDLPHESGISNFLIGSHSLDEIIQPSIRTPGLDIILSGPKPPNPSELIMGERMNELFRLLDERYDVIIIDSPPIGVVTDAMLLSKYVDITIYVIRQQVTRRQSIDFLNKLHHDRKIPHLNIILNAVKNGGGAQYGYGYGYGYGYYEEERTVKGS
jgi:tyrosine-protein kinase Etk/Wzc